jgi:hypothetical protein
MSQRNQELSGDDMAAFDALVDHLEEQGSTTTNLPNGLCGYPIEDYNVAEDNAERRDAQAYDQMERQVRGGFATIHSRIDLSVDPENIGLGRANRDISLAQLNEIRRSLRHSR